MRLEAIKADVAAKMALKMEDTDSEAKSIMKQEIEGYYTGEPDWYRRTGILKTSPNPVDISGGGLSYSMRASLNTGLSWPTGSFNGEQVIDATNNGTFGTIGNHGYWERMTEQILDAARANFSSW